jgi:hypothetical protein
VAYITTDFIGCAQISQIFRNPEAGSLPRVVRKICEIMGGQEICGISAICVRIKRPTKSA